MEKSGSMGNGKIPENEKISWHGNPNGVLVMGESKLNLCFIKECKFSLLIFLIAFIVQL